ncbi:calaxin [Prorops nasuta]|uniref:calaxin n=1 Tax=Prorops nasuta TaxID=863751 RepID=UPI0034CD5BB7
MSEARNVKMMGTCSAGASAFLMKSVSLFLVSSRKVSVHSKRQPSGSAQPKNDGRRRRRRRMPDGTGNRYSAYVTKLMESLKKRTKFSRVELDSLYRAYKKLTNSGGQKSIGSSLSSDRSQIMHNVEGMDRAVFRKLLYDTFDILTEDVLVERMFCYWDRESEGAIRLEPWIIGLDTFLRGSLKDKMEFCFRVYDLNNDGFITKDEIFVLLKNCLLKQPGEEDPDEGVRDLSELALKKLDLDHDGKISFRDYETTVKKEPLLLEAFGQCLPTAEATKNFLKSLQTSPKAFGS